MSELDLQKLNAIWSFLASETNSTFIPAKPGKWMARSTDAAIIMKYREQNLTVATEQRSNGHFQTVYHYRYCAPTDRRSHAVHSSLALPPAITCSAELPAMHELFENEKFQQILSTVGHFYQLDFAYEPVGRTGQITLKKTAMITSLDGLRRDIAFIKSTVDILLTLGLALPGKPPERSRGKRVSSLHFSNLEPLLIVGEHVLYVKPVATSAEKILQLWSKYAFISLLRFGMIGYLGWFSIMASSRADSGVMLIVYVVLAVCTGSLLTGIPRVENFASSTFYILTNRRIIRFNALNSVLEDIITRDLDLVNIGNQSASFQAKNGKKLSFVGIENPGHLFAAIKQALHHSSNETVRIEKSFEKSLNKLGDGSARLSRNEPEQ